MPTPVTNPARVSGTILTDVVGRLADANIGFNAQLPATLSGTARYAANAGFLTGTPLVFPSDYTGYSPNVILAPISIEDWLGTTPTSKLNCLLMQVYIINAINDQNVKGLLFDGTINVGIDCHVLWPNSKAVYDFDAATSAVEDTMYAVFNTRFPNVYQVWSHGVIYNGRLSIPARSAIKATGSPGFAQLVTFTVQFGLQAR